MIRVALAAICAAACAVAGCGDRYERNDLELVTAYRAKELCSCLFVMQRDEDYCVKWTTASPNIASYSIDHDGRTVETQAMLLWGAKARYVSERFGCLLE